MFFRENMNFFRSRLFTPYRKNYSEKFKVISMYKLLEMNIKMSICKISRRVNGLKAFHIYKKLFSTFRSAHSCTPRFSALFPYIYQDFFLHQLCDGTVRYIQVPRDKLITLFYLALLLGWSVYLAVPVYVEGDGV